MMDTWEPRPLPTVTPETERFWRGAAEGRLLLRTCHDCDLTFFYPRSRCPDCLGTAVSWTDAAGRGVVYTFSTSERVEGWPEAALPVVLAYVELGEGPRMLSNLVECSPGEVTVGTAVHVRFVPTERDDVAVPVFVPG